MMNDIGKELHGWARELFPLCRSLTGDGVRETLRFLSEKVGGGLVLHEVPSGTPAFDWTVPDEWNARGAFVETLDGTRVIDFAENNLHLMGYSEPVDREVTRAELDDHLYSLPEQPGVIPYVTSYYRRRWGFCMRHRDRERLGPGPFRVSIDTDLKPGSLTYGELVIPGESDREVLVSSYVCHPSMANNELSGPVVAIGLARWLLSLPRRRYTYRFYLGPETIGAIVYLSRRLEHLKRHVVAGWVLTCIGDEGSMSYMPTRRGDTITDRVARHVLGSLDPGHTEYDFLVRQSDERQYCSARVDLPVGALMRTKYGAYPQYHTSADDLHFVTPAGLAGGFELVRGCVKVLEANRVLRAVHPCEPQLGKRGLYPTLSQRGSAAGVREIRNVLTFADGEHDLLAISERLGLPMAACERIAAMLLDAELLEVLE